jgi:hypothetical protein
MRPTFHLLVVLGLAGCPWIGADELAARLDADGDGAQAVDVGGTDCDDTDPEVGPGAEERCNGIDDDCDGQVDEGEGLQGAVAVYGDGDGDGVGAGQATWLCAVPAGASDRDDDCDDTDDTVRPGASERCNGVDDDCDGTIDEGAPSDRTWFADADGDGFGDDDRPVQACIAPDGHVATAGDCDDTDAAIHPLTPWYVDGDGDGHGAVLVVLACEGPPGASLTDDDCDDGDPDVHPGAPETCTGGDADCDGLTGDDDPDVLDPSTWWLDGDGDGFGDDGQQVVACDAPADHVDQGGDCDDADPAEFPGARWYVDGDGDGHGGSSSVDQCEQPSGTFATATDCDDTDADVHPGADERCDPDDRDEDCDGRADDADDDAIDPGDWFVDDDRDGWGTGLPVAACDPPGSAWADRDGDCDDTDAELHPDTQWFLDGDGDGFGTGGVAAVQCAAPPGHALLDGDCDDTEGTTYPGAPEQCDAVDSDCDTDLNDPDATGASTWYLDDDGDGWGDDGSTIDACQRPAGHVALGGDCDDGDDAFHPEADDLCYDGIDHDCRDDDDDDCDDDGFVGRVVGGDDCDDDDPTVFPGVITTRYVPSEHPTIQQAIDASCPDDLIEIAAGTYVERLVTELPVSLRGQGSGITSIDGFGMGPVLVADGPVTVESLTLQNGANSDGGCVEVGAAGPVTLQHVDLVGCFGDLGSALYAAAATVVLEDVLVTDSFAGNAPIVLASPLAGSRLSGLQFDRTAGALAGAIMLSGGTADLDAITVLDATSDNVAAIASFGTSGTFTDLLVDGATGGAHGGMLVTNSLGLPDPVVIDGLTVIEPSSGLSSTALFITQAVDVTVTDLTVIGGEPSPYLVPPPAVFVSTDGGEAHLQHLSLQGVEGSVQLFSSSYGDAISLAHSTVAYPAEGIVASTVGSSEIDVSHVVVAGSLGDGLSTFGDVSVDHTNVFGSAGIDWLDPKLAATNGNLSVDPGFVTASAFYPPALLTLQLRDDSLLRDAGDPGLLDPDGTRADIGLFGGVDASPTAYDDLDADGLLDAWEALHDVAFPTADDDADGLDNATEFSLGTLPNAADSDGDGLDDAVDPAPTDGNAP